MGVSFKGVLPPFFFFFLLLLSEPSLAGTIHTWHYGDALVDVLRSVSGYLGSPAFEAVFKFVVLLSFILLLLRMASFFGDVRSVNPLSIGIFYIVVILVSALLMNAKVSTTVVDDCRGTSTTVDNVPWLVAKPLEWISAFEKEIRSGMVNYFNVPPSFKNNDGCWTGYEILKPAVTYDARDPYLRLSMKNYIKDCVIPNIMAGDLDRFAIVNSRDLWNDFACTVGQVCAALFTTYYNSSNPDGIVDGCPNVYARITFDLVNEYQRAYEHVRDRIFGTGSTVSATVIPSYLADASSFLMAVGLTGDNLIRQAITIQQLNQVSAEFATAVAYQERYLSALAKINMLDFGRGGTIGALKAVIMTVFSGLLPIMALLFVSPVGRKVFYVFLTIPAWLGMWSVAEVSVVASLNSFIGRNERFDFVLSDIDRMNLIFNKAAQISSLMSDYIPLLTFMLISGSMYAMVHFAKGMTATLSDQHGAKVMASGNFDAGNVRVNSFQQDAMAVASSTFGQVGWNQISGDNWSTHNINTENTTAKMVNQFDPTTGAKISGTWKDKDRGQFIGDVNGGTFQGNGLWQREGRNWELVNGSATVRDPHSLEQITGRQISGLRDAEVRMANGQLVYARGIDEMTGAEVTYRRSSDGIETMTYNYGSWTAKLMKDKNGEWKVVGGSGPVDLNVVQRYVENLENSKAQMDRVATAFRSSEGISNADSQTFNAGYRLAYDIAYGKGGASEYERGFARDMIRSTEEAALTRLANEGKLSLEGKEIDEFEARKKGRGGISLGLPEFLKKKLGENLRLGASVDKVIATKDGYVVQDTKGRYWFFGKNESINDALRDAWKTTVSGENKDFFSYRENATDGKYTSEDFRKDLTSFRNRASEYAATRAEELSRRISFARQNARDINAKATQLLIGDYVNRADGDDIRDKTGKALTELNHLVSTPQGMRELIGAADRVVDELMKDRSLERPNVNETEVRSAANRAEVEGTKAKNVDVQAPSKDAEQVYQQTKKDIEGRMDSMGEEYQQSREAVDAQRNVYENTKMNSPVETLPKLQQFDRLKRETEDLMIERNELINKINEEEWALLHRDIPPHAKLFGMSKREMLELIKDEDKLRAYEEQIRNAPPHGQLKPDPNALWSYRERWLNIQRMKQELANIQQELNEKLREYEELKPYAQAKDLQQGDYEVKYRDDKGPGKHPKIETATERATERLDKEIENYKEERKTPEEIREEIKKELKEMQKRDLDAFRDIFG